MLVVDDPEYSFELSRRHKTWTEGRELAFAQQLNHWKDQPVRMLEIGSFEGASAVWLLKNILTHPDAELHCVDCQHAPRMKILRDNIDKTGRGTQATIHRLDSRNLPRHFQNESFHFVYVDAAHDARSVLRDVMNAYLLCKVGGLIGCDDYRIPQCEPDGSSPMEAIDAFTSIYHESVEVTLNEYQLWFRRLN